MMGNYSNLYDVTFINKTYKDKQLTLKSTNPGVSIKMIGDNKLVKAESKMNSKFFLILNPKNVDIENNKIEVKVYHNEELISTEKIKFYLPEYLK